MVAQALDWLAPKADDRVLDLFSGLGNFALPLARQPRPSPDRRGRGHDIPGNTKCA